MLSKVVRLPVSVEALVRIDLSGAVNKRVLARQRTNPLVTCIQPVTEHEILISSETDVQLRTLLIDGARFAMLSAGAAVSSEVAQDALESCLYGCLSRGTELRPLQTGFSATTTINRPRQIVKSSRAGHGQ